jgi:hypothetical protein
MTAKIMASLEKAARTLGYFRGRHAHGHFSLFFFFDKLTGGERIPHPIDILIMIGSQIAM